MFKGLYPLEMLKVGRFFASTLTLIIYVYSFVRKRKKNSIESKSRWHSIDWPKVFSGKIHANRYYLRSGLVRKNLIIAHAGSHMPSTVVISSENELLDAAKKLDDEKFVLKLSDSSNASGIHFLDVTDTSHFQRVAMLCRDNRKRVLQSYVRSILVSHRKIHVRALVLAVGDLDVYLFKECRVLLATVPFSCKEWNNPLCQITNRSFNVLHSHDYDESFQNRRLDEIDWEKEAIESQFIYNPTSTSTVLDTKITHSFLWKQMAIVISDLFSSLARSENRKQFFSLPNCWELFGFDFAIDYKGNVSLLEVNPSPSLSALFTGRSEAELFGSSNFQPTKKNESTIPTTFKRIYRKRY
eukprot:g935.t1